MQLNVPNVIKVILDNSAHISKETYALARQATGRTLRIHFHALHGSCQNIVESLTYSILRHIRVMSKQKLKNRVIDANGQLASGGSHLVP